MARSRSLEATGLSNVTIVEGVADSDFLVAGMSGGACGSGNCSSGSCAP